MPYKYQPKEVRISLKKRTLVIFSVIFLSLILLIAFYPYLHSYFSSFFPIKKINYYGVPIEFRDDLRLAKNIQVYPNESYLKQIFLRRDIETITLAILNSTNQTNLIGVEAYEITFKLTVFYSLNKVPVQIKGKSISNVYELKGNSTNPIIVVIPPSLANETLVRAENYTVYISGKNLKELDLATIKFLMVILGIEV